MYDSIHHDSAHAPHIVIATPKAAPSSPPALTPIAFARAIVQTYRQRQMDPCVALSVAQITPDILHNDQARLTAAQFERLSGHAMRELDDEALGWFRRRLPWGSYGMLARASLSSADLQRALTRWCRHHSLLTDDIELRLHVIEGQAEIRLIEHVTLGGLQEFAQVSVLRNILGLACWYIDSRIPLLAAQFSFAAPPHASAYPVLFPAPTRFQAAITALRFDARYLTLPLQRDEKALNQMLQHALPLMVQAYRRDRLLPQRVRQVLLTQPEAGHCATALAEKLHMSTRTLHRQLQEHHSSLQGLKDEVRRERATELLQRTQMPIKQIAQAVGFRHEKSFIRAFRLWTGISPGQSRAQPGD